MISNPSRLQYPLAYSFDGDPLPLPAEAVAWRVKRGGRRGRPRPVFDPDTGRQLELPVTSAIEDLAAAGCSPGRYRLEAIDADGRALPGLVAACEIAPCHNDEPASDAPPTATAQMAQLVRDSVAANNHAMKLLADFVINLRPEPRPIHVEVPQPVVQAPPSTAAEQWVRALSPVLAPLAQMVANAIIPKTSPAPTTSPA